MIIISGLKRFVTDGHRCRGSFLWVVRQSAMLLGCSLAFLRDVWLASALVWRAGRREAFFSTVARSYLASRSIWNRVSLHLGMRFFSPDTLSSRRVLWVPAVLASQFR